MLSLRDRGRWAVFAFGELSVGKVLMGKGILFRGDALGWWWLSLQKKSVRKT
jgi:hypothetical protein